MTDVEKDKVTNECMTKATKLAEEAKAAVKDSDKNLVFTKAYEAAFASIKGILAMDEIFLNNEFAEEKEFRRMYVDNGRTSMEMAETLNRLAEYKDKLAANPELKLSGPEAGYFASKIKFFVEEMTEFIIERNAAFWGQ